MAQVGERTYVLGRGSALASDGNGNFTFAPAAKLAPGSYDVTYTVTNADETTATAVAAAAIVVAEPPPPPEPVVEPEPAPVVEPEPAPVVQPEPAPVAEPAPAPVDASELSPVVRQIVVGKLPEARVIDCNATFARVHQIFPIRFAFDLDDLGSPYDQSVRQYAALLKDPRCLALKVEIAGHADYKGSIAYNQDLSERRAQRVLDALIAVGIDGTRLSVKGYSEISPIDPARTNDARMLNRRVDMVLMK